MLPQILTDDLIVDQYGRQSLFSTYVQFQCKISHPFSVKHRMSGSRSSNDDEMRNSTTSSVADTYSLYDNVSVGGRSLNKKGCYTIS